MVSLPAKTYGQDFNFFQKVTVTSTTFGAFSDIVIPFSTQGLMLLNEDTSAVIQFSFKGVNVNGELNPTLPSKTLTFDNIRVCSIFFKLTAPGSAVISVYAWSIP